MRGTSRALRWTFGLFLLGLAIPLQTTIIPVYCLIAKARMYDTLGAVVLPSAAFAIPLTVIILVNFLRDIPDELYESMRADGTGHWRMLWNPALPLSRPALITVTVTVTIYDALNVWNGFPSPYEQGQDAFVGALGQDQREGRPVHPPHPGPLRPRPPPVDRRPHGGLRQVAAGVGVGDPHRRTPVQPR
nr:ABC transporter permease subunit [Streptomyces sp. NRRL B-3229]